MKISIYRNPALDFGYEPITTFWDDFCIADAFGIDAIKETYDNAFSQWKSDYKYLTELTMVLNHKIWQWYEKDDEKAKLYDTLWKKTDQYGCENLKGDELSYFYRTLD